jgi:preprotein translocase subunit YajC
MILPLFMFLFYQAVFAENNAPAQDNADYSVAYINDFDGDCSIIRAGAVSGEDITELYMPLYKGDTVETGAGAKAEVVFDDDTVVKLDEGSSIVISDLVRSKNKKTFLEVLQGCVLLIVKKLDPGDDFTVKTKMAVAAVKGTEFAVQAADKNGNDGVAVYDGSVKVAMLDSGGGVKDNTVVEKNSEVMVSGGARRFNRMKMFSGRFLNRRAEFAELRTGILKMRELKRNGKISDFKYNRRLEFIQKIKKLRNNPEFYNRLDGAHKARIERMIKHEGAFRQALEKKGKNNYNGDKTGNDGDAGYGNNRKDKKDRNHDGNN